TVKETPIHLKKLDDADECFITTSIIEVLPVVKIDSCKIGKGKPGPITHFLHDEMKKAIQKYCKEYMARS
ncbi:MAG: hypothetical protein AB1546_11795, partial [bacterium]